ncbi:hypothetical protein [Leptothermofonsia sp. ETS-13]|uniref:hypothetical protein n=1 Tax=Leptothermofonsia sp. ETS-13 TaxID=3035696 RepID=UPI003B9DCA63
MTNNRLPQQVKQLFIVGLAISSMLCVESQSWRGKPDYVPDYFQYIRMGIEYLCLNIIYVIWLVLKLKKTQETDKSPSFYSVLKFSTPFLLIAFIAYPTTADIYTYLHSGLMTLNGLNPYLVPAGKFDSIISPFLAWYQTSTYGPVSQVLFAIAAWFTPVSIVLGVYVFKLLCLLFHIGNSYFIGIQLKGSRYQAAIAGGYLLTPILLFEHVAQAHVDVFLSTILIILIACLRQQRYILSVVFSWIGFLCKTLPIIWLPLVLLLIIRRRRWKILLLSACFSLILIATLSFSILPDYKAWISLLNSGVIWQTAGSFHNILEVVLHYLQSFLPKAISGEKSYRLVIPFKGLTYLGYIIFYIWLLLRAYFKKSYTENHLILDMGWATLILFLFATPWYQPWYASILLPLVALLITTPFHRQSLLFIFASLIFCLSSTSYHLLSVPGGQPVLFWNC